jgi:hypothetical protein
MMRLNPRSQNNTLGFSPENLRKNSEDGGSMFHFHGSGMHICVHTALPEDQHRRLHCCENLGSAHVSLSYLLKFYRDFMFLTCMLHTLSFSSVFV